MEVELAATKLRADELLAERDRLREAYRHLELQVELQRRRLFVAKAERIDTKQLELEFAATLAKLNEIAGQLPADVLEQLGSPGGTTKPKRKPTGRRDLRDVELPEERIVIVDGACEGTAARIDTEETCQIMWRRGGLVRVVTVRIKYRSVPSSPTPGLAASGSGEAIPAPVLDAMAPALDTSDLAVGESAPALAEPAPALAEPAPMLETSDLAFDKAVTSLDEPTQTPDEPTQTPDEAPSALDAAASRLPRSSLDRSRPPLCSPTSSATSSAMASLFIARKIDSHVSASASIAVR